MRAANFASPKLIVSEITATAFLLQITSQHIHRRAVIESPANQANPAPTQTVKWGSQTYDEMMMGYLETFRPMDAE